ncbi:uncharacterized protein LOC128215180 [Mya arenaria]|uniref:uncharacterized protein LOC128215180 n=1 Tax=Mya arenaria TaxID=6604 RepID=UPI0022E85B11|nr:uncharacterized protein LOC128215180 [Mya arenaria]
MIQLKKSFGDQTLSRTAVFEWHRRFKEGRESTSDDARPALVAKKREMVKSMIDRDRRVSTREVAEECDIGVATAYKLITEEFKMTKVCARWIPRLLDDNQMKDRVNKSLNFLRSYRREGERFLQRIITTDETSFHLFDPETKQQSMVWKTSSSPPPKKARVTKSKGKFMFIVFMDNNGVILTRAVPAGVTVNAAYYSKHGADDDSHDDATTTAMMI